MEDNSISVRMIHILKFALLLGYSRGETIQYMQEDNLIPDVGTHIYVIQGDCTTYETQNIVGRYISERGNGDIIAIFNQ